MPANNRLQPSFLAFVDSTALDAAKHFDKAQNIERLLREAFHPDHSRISRDPSCLSRRRLWSAIEEKQLPDCRR
jgi:hypothetical protein